MTRKLKPVEIPVSEPIRTAVLGVAVRTENGGFTTVGTLVDEAQEALRKANAALAGNSLVGLAARDMMKGQRRRGGATIGVNANGSVVLRVAYGQDNGDLASASPGGAGLPSLKDLRKQAALKGVDIADLGRQKKRIMDRLASWERDQETEATPCGGRLRDEVSQSTPLHSTKIPRR